MPIVQALRSCRGIRIRGSRMRGRRGGAARDKEKRSISKERKCMRTRKTDAMESAPISCTTNCSPVGAPERLWCVTCYMLRVARCMSPQSSHGYVIIAKVEGDLLSSSQEVCVSEEESCSKDAPKTAGTMHGKSIHWIVSPR